MTNIGREYAIALFETAYDEGSLDAVREELTEIRKLLKKESDYIGFLMNPAISKEERLDSLSEAFEGNVEDTLYSFLAVMAINNHMGEFFVAAKEFEKMYEDYKKISFAVITSAVKLTDEEKRKIVTRLRKVTGKAISPIYKVDESIIGGVTVTCDGMFFDGSVARNLKNIKEVIS
ncbi:MAG: ATP synthase F1 subunit delta [Saccharofermentans sp.]|nr:ATP synthase F1 subunit delta [Saccharofermentans sp.]